MGAILMPCLQQRGAMDWRVVRLRPSSSCSDRKSSEKRGLQLWGRGGGSWTLSEEGTFV